MLTEHQKKALQYTSHLSVTANAGAGKTTVLVQRFIEILIGSGEPISRLVAITFTENAAGELRRRIADVIEARLGERGAPEKMRLLARARDELSSANIGTIHSFCARLLREYPVEGGVDAAFSVIDGVDRELLLKEVLRDTVESFLTGKEDARDREAFIDTLRLLGRRRVLRYLEAWLEKREVIDRMVQPGGCLAEQLSDGEILDCRRNLIDEEVRSLLDEPSWREALARLLTSASGKKSVEVAAIFSRWKNLRSPEEKVGWYGELSSRVFTSTGTLRKDWLGAHSDPASSGVDPLILTNHREECSGILGAMAQEGGPGGELLMLQSVRVLLKVYRRALDAYSGRKDEFSQLDFDDLQMKARDVLQREEVRKQLAGKFKFIMIDEYQDTDQLQYEIVRLLTSDFRSGNLFIVGDPKQSIFSFRSADVRIFEETKRAIETASSPGSGNSISLAESFRLLTAPVDFVNRVFSRTMARGASRFDVGHDELVRGRSNPAEGRIEMLLVASSPDPGSGRAAHADSSASVAIECRMIASKIAALAGSGYPVFDPADETARPVRFSDVAVLLRGRTHLEQLEKALVDHGIPYVLSGGIGFYQTQEVLDFYSFFKFLLNREDDVALAALLRSPFFAISDDRLFEISREQHGTLWGKMKQYAHRHRGDGLLRAVRILEEDLELANRLPVPFLVQRIMLQTGWHGIVSGLPFGGQNVANVRKLLRIARDFERKGFHSLFDFVERLKILIEREPRESQAPPEIAENCVQILTVHGAKGLEFPVAFLPFLDQKFRHDSAPYIDASLGIAFPVPGRSEAEEELHTPYFELMKRGSELKREAEEKRIFYVACTRARDLLVLSGRVVEGATHPSCLRWTLESLGLSPPPILSGDIILPESPVKTIEWVNGAGEVRSIMHALCVSVTVADRFPEVVPFEAMSAARGSRFPELWIEPVEGRIRGEFFSATQIRTYLECPTKYYLKYVLGLPEANTPPGRVEENEDADDTPRGELEGTLTHLILRDCFTPAITDSEVEENARRLISNTLPLLAPEERDRTTAAIVVHVLNFLRSPFGIEVLSADTSKTEFSLSSIFGDDYVTGTIDRLCMNRDGDWHLLDYKTDKIRASELGARAELYRPQLALYAWLTHRLYGRIPIRASLVFLSHPLSPVHFTFGEAEIRSFEELLADSISRIKAHNFERMLPVCQTCTYRTGDDCLIRFRPPAQVSNTG